jgi:hypothetical protein
MGSHRAGPAIVRRLLTSDASKLTNPATLATELNKLVGKPVPDVSLAEVQQHVRDGDLVAWLEDRFEGKISDDQCRALTWLAERV